MKFFERNLKKISEIDYRVSEKDNEDLSRASRWAKALHRTTGGVQKESKTVSGNLFLHRSLSIQKVNFPVGLSFPRMEPLIVGKMHGYLYHFQ